MISALTFTESLCLILSRPAETYLILWLHGNSSIVRAHLSGSCRHISQKQIMQWDLKRSEQYLYQIGIARSNSRLANIHLICFQRE